VLSKILKELGKDVPARFSVGLSKFENGDFAEYDNM
jgi:hypothetical protein